MRRSRFQAFLNASLVASLAGGAGLLTPALAVAGPSSPDPDAGCWAALKRVLSDTTAPDGRLRTAIDNLLNKKGRAQEALVQKFLDDKAAQAAARGGDADEDWAKTVADWQDDVLGRMRPGSAGPYPTVEELLALMAARSPTFKSGLAEFLHDHGSLRFKIAESLHSADGGIGKGGKTLRLGQNELKLPTRRPWSDDEFNAFLTEISDSVFRAAHPEPSFVKTWAKSFVKTSLDAESPEGRAVWRRFADRMQADYRSRYKAFLSGVSREAFGEPRPEVVADFYKWGIKDTVYRRLAAYKVLFSKEGGNLIERHTGLTLAEIDALNSSRIYDALPRGVKNAIIASKNPGLTAALLLDDEVERLSLEVMWFVQPVIEAGLLYSTANSAYAVGNYEIRSHRLEKDIQKNPEKYLPPTQKADDERLKNFDENIAALTAERTRLQRELDQGQTLTAAEQTERQQQIRKIDVRIANYKQLEDDLKKGITGQSAH